MKIEKVDKLVKEKKYKKALSLLNKITERSSYIWHLKGICHVALKQYSQALFAYKQALLNSEGTKRVSTLNDLAMISLILKNVSEAQSYYRQSVSIDPSANNAFAREQLTALLLAEADYEAVLSYGKKLLTLSKYAAKAYLMLLQAAIKLNNQVSLQNLCKSIEMSLGEFTEEQLITLLNILLKHKQKEAFDTIMEKLHQQYHNAIWLNHFDELTRINEEEIKSQEHSQLVVADGENEKLTELVKALITHTKEKGAYFNEKFQVRIDNGELSVHYFGNNSERLIEIPATCLPLLSDFHFEVKRNKLICFAKPQMINPESLKTMELLTDIYNQGNKISKWEKVNPFLALHKSPKVLKKLLELKPGNPKLLVYENFYNKKDRNSLLLETFLGSRVFNYRKSFLQENGIITKNENELGLLSIVDFLNHKLNSNNFALSKTGVYISGKSASKSDSEVFVKYNVFDAVSAFLLYGFVDTDSPILFSIPCELKTSYGETWKVTALSGSKGSLRKGEFKHSKGYIPTFKRLNQTTISLDKLVVPTAKADDLLKDVLMTIINTTAPLDINKTDSFFKAEIAFLEKQIIINNKKYWNEFKGLVKEDTMMNGEVKTQLKILINHAESALTTYANSNSLYLF